MEQELSAVLASAHAAVTDAICAALVKHQDETGYVDAATDQIWLGRDVAGIGGSSARPRRTPRGLICRRCLRMKWGTYTGSRTSQQVSAGRPT